MARLTKLLLCLTLRHGEAKCVPLSYWLEDVKSKMLALWSGVELVPNAYAYMTFRFRMAALARPLDWGFMYTENYGGAGVSAWEFSGFGLEIGWYDVDFG